MTFFSRLATTALAAVTLFGAAAARAHHLPRQPYNKHEVRILTDVAETVGIRIFNENSGPAAAKACKKGVLGIAQSNGQLLLCIANHKGNTTELGDTIRHEMLHMVQFCNKNRPLLPARSAEFIKTARQHLHWDVKHYDQSSWAKEAEARVMAYHLNERQIAALLTRFCKS